MTFDAALDAWVSAEIQPQLLGRFELFEAGYSAGVAAERERLAQKAEQRSDGWHCLTADEIRAGAPAREDEIPVCWACNDTRIITTSNNGSGLVEEECPACKEKPLTESTPEHVREQR